MLVVNIKLYQKCHEPHPDIYVIEVCDMRTIYLELGHKLPDKVPVGIVLLPKGDRAVHSVVLVEESACRQPHPICIVYAPVIINQQSVEHIPASCPGAVQISTGEEACDCMPRKVMHPSLHHMHHASSPASHAVTSDYVTRLQIQKQKPASHTIKSDYVT